MVLYYWQPNLPGRFDCWCNGTKRQRLDRSRGSNWYRSGISNIILLGHLRDCANEVALPCKLLCIHGYHSNKPACSKDSLRFSANTSQVAWQLLSYDRR